MESDSTPTAEEMRKLAETLHNFMVSSAKVLAQYPRSLDEVSDALGSLPNGLRDMREEFLLLAGANTFNTLKAGADAMDERDRLRAEADEAARERSQPFAPAWGSLEARK